MFPDLTVSPGALSTALGAMNQPQLLEEFLISSIKSDNTAPLTFRMVEQHPFNKQTKFRALFATVESNKVMEFESLLDQDAPLMMKIHAQRLSILHFVATMGRVDFLTSLFQKRQEEAAELLNKLALDEEDVENEEQMPTQTPLSYALNSNLPEALTCARALIAYKADVNQPNEDGLTPIAIALKMKMHSIAALTLLKTAGAIKRHIPSSNSLTLLLSNNYALKDEERSEQIKLLAECGEDLNAKDLFKTSLMSYTIRWKNFKSTKTLIFLGADIPSLDECSTFRRNPKEKAKFQRMIEITHSTQLIALNCHPLETVIEYDSE